MKSIKHIVMTRWWWDSSSGGSGHGILDDEYLDTRLKYMVHNLIPSLNNQTNMDFEWILVVSPKHQQYQMEKVESLLKWATPKFNYQIIPYGEMLNSYIKDQWIANDYVILTRIDDDDFVVKYAVQDTRDIVSSNQASIVACGYNCGYKYYPEKYDLARHDINYERGHVSVFQSIIYDTRLFDFSLEFLPLKMKHYNVLETLQDLSDNIKFIVIDRPNGYIWFRHSDAISYTQHSHKYKPICATDKLRNELRDQFAFNLPI